MINTRTTSEKIDVARVFVFSTFHLVRSVVYCIAGLQGEHMNLTSITIMIGTLVGGLLQLCLMKKTVWAYVRLVYIVIHCIKLYKGHAPKPDQPNHFRRL